jgi:hypothetical protein
MLHIRQQNTNTFYTAQMTEKDKIFYNVWCCAYQRRYNAKLKQDWELYWREHQTLLMCLKIAEWTTFDTEKPNYLK